MSTADGYFYNIDVSLNHFSEKCNNVFCRDGSRNFSIIHFNIRSIKANGDALIVYLLLLKRKFDVICLTET